MNTQILVVEDHEPTRNTICEALRAASYHVRAASDGQEALARIAERVPDSIVSDYRMKPMNGLELLREIRRTLDLPFILYSAGADAEAIFRAGREGAFVFLEYPFRIDDHLVPTIEEGLARRRNGEAEQATGAARLVGTSRAMQRVRSLIRRIAPSKTTVLITGETGTGKELVASAIHEESGRETLVPVSVTELAEGLLESELFGHARGAFTGAVSSHRGLFERADGGTLFLDEIGDAAPPLQAKLLRILEHGVVRPVGSSRTAEIDVRIVAATNRDLAAEVAAGGFREDLYYRIRRAEIQLPPLRDRTDDLPELVRSLLATAARELRIDVPEVGHDFLAALAKHPWPGNVRELQALLQNVLLWCDDDGPLRHAHLAKGLLMVNPGLSSEGLADRERMVAAYEASGCNQEAARRALGLSRGEWRHRWSRYGLEMLSRRTR